MKKTAVIYWSGTGNTEAMANAVLEGMKSAGAEADLLTPDQVDPAAVSGYAAIAFGCPAMGDETLEEMDFEPMFSACKGSSAPTAGAAATGCAPGRRTATSPTSAWPCPASSAARRRTRPRWKPAAPWARPWLSERGKGGRRSPLFSSWPGRRDGILAGDGAFRLESRKKPALSRHFVQICG